MSFVGSDFDIVFDAGQLAEFAFDDDAVSVCVFNDFFVRAILSSKECFEPSIMTEVKPPSMQSLQVSKSAPWSR